MPARTEMPDTIKRSPKKAQDTWAAAHDSAVKTYGEGERAHRTAYAALKHEFEKVGDRWEPKGHKGPSDPGAAKPYGEGGKTYGGVDVLGSSKQELYERARKLGVKGASRMNKEELGREIARRQ